MRHLTEVDLERILDAPHGRIPDDDAEQHRLICATCQDRLQELAESRLATERPSPVEPAQAAPLRYAARR